jgi:hypothetical protein
VTRTLLKMHTQVVAAAERSLGSCYYCVAETDASLLYPSFRSVPISSVQFYLTMANNKSHEAAT